jgi:6-phosphogluconolactonase (cycloisomerase 2 family)
MPSVTHPPARQRRAPTLSALAIAAAVVALLGLACPLASSMPLYTANEASSSISAFTIQGDGSLLQIACKPPSNCTTGTGSVPQHVAVDPSGRFLYAVDSATNRISPFAIAADGSLSPLACKPASNCDTGELPEQVGVDPSGRFLYVVNRTSASISPFAIHSDGTLAPIACSPAAACKTPAGGDPEGLAIAPSGNDLYVANFALNTISIFAIAADGSLSRLACSPTSNCATGFEPLAMAVTPDGRNLYDTNVDSSEESVSVFQINADGTLAPTCSPSVTCVHAGIGAANMAMSPDGRFLYTSNESSDDVSPFAVGADGSLTPIACTPSSTCSTGSSADGVTVSPSGRFLYVAGSEVIVPFAIGAGGSLTPIACSPPDCTTASDPTGVVAVPDQGPVAALATTVAPAGSPSTLDASGSSDVDGEVVRYDWDLGDGTTLSTSTATLAHTYETPGDYTVKLTVTDDMGCSTTQTFTGQTASCNGSAAASTTASITVPSPSPPTFPPTPPSSLSTPPMPAPALTITRFAESAKRWREGNALAKLSRTHSRTHKLPVGTSFSFGLSAPARVRLAFAHPATGRRVAGRCVAQTKHNGRKRRCTRTLTAGALSLSALSGVEKISFAGRLSRSRRLKPGRYTVTITATDAAGRRSAPASLRFVIVGR